MNSSELSSPILGLIWGRWNDENKDNLKMGLCEEDEIQDGWLISPSVNSSELIFYVSQTEIFEMLEGGVLTINQRQVEVIYDRSGEGRS